MDPAMETACLARQPIVDSSGNLFAYELLFRSCLTGTSEHTDAVVATAQVLENTLNNIGVQNLVGPHKAFINCSREMLLSGMLNSLDPQRFVLEILETVRIDDELQSAAILLRQNGFELALDDFVFSPEVLHHTVALLPALTYIKMDLVGNSPKQLREAVRLLKPKGKIMLAEKVETGQEQQSCLEEGFELFQGYFFARPELVSTHKLDSRITGILQIFQVLQKDPDMPVLEASFKSQPEVMINLLRYMNSAAIALRTPVNSIRQAIALVGMRNLKQWLMLMLYARSENAHGALHSPLLENAMQRACLLEGIAKQTAPFTTLSEQAFLVGILSRMDALCRMPMKNILSDFDLGQEIADALLYGKGVLGLLVLLVGAMESNSGPIVQDCLRQLKLLPVDFQRILMDSYGRSADLFRVA
jgi:c-di-GMP-related signal transduction protein